MFSLKNLFFSNKRQKEVNPDGRGDGEDLQVELQTNPKWTEELTFILSFIHSFSAFPLIEWHRLFIPPAWHIKSQQG